MKEQIKKMMDSKDSYEKMVEFLEDLKKEGANFILRTPTTEGVFRYKSYSVPTESTKLIINSLLKSGDKILTKKRLELLKSKEELDSEIFDLIKDSIEFNAETLVIDGEIHIKEVDTKNKLPLWSVLGFLTKFERMSSKDFRKLQSKIHN